MLELIVMAVSVVLSVAVASFVFARNPRGAVNRLYALVTLSFVCLAVANYLSLRTVDRLIPIRAVVFFTTLLMSCLYYLIYKLDSKHSPFDEKRKLGLYFTGLVAVLVWTPLVFSGLTSGSNPSPVPAVGAVLFFAHLVGTLCLVVTLLIKRVRSTTGIERSQYSYVLFGMAPLFLFAPITAFIMPVLLKNVSLIALSPLYFAFFVISIGYAIVKHRLFDVRAVVARSLGYAFAMVLLAFIYGSVVFGISNTLFDLHIPLIAQVLLSVATAIAGLIFPTLKIWFDRMTNKLFYRDAYDPQEVFDRLNKVLVSSIDIHYLMSHSNAIIESALKPEHVMIAIPQGETDFRIFGSYKRQFKHQDFTRMRAIMQQIPRKVIVADYIDDPRLLELKQLMTSNGLAVLIRLAHGTKRNPEAGLGFMALGSRKSGVVYGTTDIRVLEAIANELVLAIQNALHYEEIQKFNEVLQARVDEATRKLRTTNEKLRALDETKDDFISMASHQLRTPLTSVKGYLSMVLEGDAGEINETQKKMLGQAFVSSQRMVYLIADLLNVSRLRTGKFVIEPTPTNLAHMVGEELDQLVEAAASRNIELTYDKPKDFPDLPLDETKTRQVIMNFVDNAIYYTPSGGHIKVVLEDTPTSVELKVVDDGMGVPKTEQHHLFTKFYRAGNARKARPDGTGLGLYMAKKVILAQGGSILFESKEGKGSTFGFLFPKSPRKATAELPVASAAHTKK